MLSVLKYRQTSEMYGMDDAVKVPRRLAVLKYFLESGSNDDDHDDDETFPSLLSIIGMNSFIIFTHHVSDGIKQHYTKYDSTLIATIKELDSFIDGW